jgi:hypothetical protein
MIERTKVPGQSNKPKSSILSLLQSIFAIIGVISTIFICMIAALMVISPSNFQDVLVQLYPLDTQEPQVVVVTATQPLATTTPTPLPATSTPVPKPPSGEWMVRAYNTDDVNVLVVNGHMVGASNVQDPLKDTGLIDINPYLLAGDSNYVTFVNVNGPRGGVWGFTLHHDGAVVWGNEGRTEQSDSIGYYKTIQIFSDNTVVELPPSDPQGEHLQGQWSARVSAADLGLIFINGVPAAAGYQGVNMGWFDTSDYLFSGIENEVTAMVWNFDGEYSWDMAIQVGEMIVWGSSNQGTDQAGEVFHTSFIIDSNGNVIP